MRVLDFCYYLFPIKRNELPLFIWAFCFIFMLFFAYALLRPLRDALGIEGGQDELKWLFMGTFIICIIASLTLMFVSTKIKRKFYVDCVIVFFALNLAIFYIAMQILESGSNGFLWLSRSFYIWVSVFNLFVFSSAWSLLADVFDKESSMRLFGMIAAGASLGSISGALVVVFLSRHIASSTFVFVALGSLLLALVCKICIMQILKKQSLKYNKVALFARFEKSIDAKNPFVGFHLILHSRYLLYVSFFILLLTSISTFLYMEQARVINTLFSTRESRIEAFAGIDFIVQSCSLIIQIFFTAKITRIFGLSALLGSLGFVLTLGFVFLAFMHPAFVPLAVVMSVRRIGEYALVKPGREMLFVPLSANEKYKVKNFLDCVLYRAGDMLSGQIEGVFASFGVIFVLCVGALLSFVWGMLGVKLAKMHESLHAKNQDEKFYS
ncbi:NTP/NDP exchange transporter [Helicobacter cinaedi]|uniref:MFS family protein n=1 Tax=Helicobacter cinaedi TaxID=213 RepID=A0A377JXZ9_9HELI|nr:MFS transporter [Helicobacter cinaedi]STP13602.1 MFS family protein [Helicobacter cinaedi]